MNQQVESKILLLELLDGRWEERMIAFARSFPDRAKRGRAASAKLQVAVRDPLVAEKRDLGWELIRIDDEPFFLGGAVSELAERSLYG